MQGCPLTFSGTRLGGPTNPSGISTLSGMSAVLFSTEQLTALAVASLDGWLFLDSVRAWMSLLITLAWFSGLWHFLAKCPLSPHTFDNRSVPPILCMIVVGSWLLVLRYSQLKRQLEVQLLYLLLSAASASFVFSKLSELHSPYTSFGGIFSLLTAVLWAGLDTTAAIKALSSLISISDFKF